MVAIFTSRCDLLNDKTAKHEKWTRSAGRLIDGVTKNSKPKFQPKRRPVCNVILRLFHRGGVDPTIYVIYGGCDNYLETSGAGNAVAIAVVRGC